MESKQLHGAVYDQLLLEYINQVIHFSLAVF